jgi:hypothetical protein
MMISCKFISFLKDFVNFTSFLRKKSQKNRLKEWSKGADVNEGKFFKYESSVSFIIALKADLCI